MSKPRIVMDTNVLYRALRSNLGVSYRLFSLIGREHFELCVSAPLVIEYEDVALRYADAIGLSIQDIWIAVDYICGVAHKQYIYFRWHPYLPDPKDDMVLELAIASQSKYIVTYNIKDFRGVQDFGIQAIRPQQFLEKLDI